MSNNPGEFFGVLGNSSRRIVVPEGEIVVHNCESKKIFVTVEWKPKIADGKVLAL